MNVFALNGSEKPKIEKNMEIIVTKNQRKKKTIKKNKRHMIIFAFSKFFCLGPRLGHGNEITTLASDGNRLSNVFHLSLFVWGIYFN